MKTKQIKYNQKLAPVCIFEIFSTHKYEYFGYTAGIQLQNETKAKTLSKNCRQVAFGVRKVCVCEC